MKQLNTPRDPSRQIQQRELSKDKSTHNYEVINHGHQEKNAERTQRELH